MIPNKPEYTRQEFDELSIAQIYWKITPRIIVLPEGEVMRDSMEENKDWWDRMIFPEGIEKPSRETFDNEFATYKGELLLTLEPLWEQWEAADALKARFMAIYEKDHGCPSFIKVFPQANNPLAYVEENKFDTNFQTQFSQVETEELLRDKQTRIDQAYKTMNSEVYAQMASVFGTTNAESAQANQATWSIMLQYPSEFVGKLGFATVADVMNFAQPKVDSVIAYGVWRMQRIEQFRQDRLAILAE